ncbi:glutathione peroxidase [Alteromonas sediminis]|uniref:Glutathione peroxidase n=1 Tax=Alteromonas sediminis TaxID=2259342 RepID=A0A3N5YDD5_9ALTE|nr:glutathione peroxidase [Alteromonas sediminis]RPJ67555.1 glutathione peroxidase [Alteromonas sediminis]
MSNSVHEFSARLNDGTEQDLSEYKGQVLLIVNTASKCGFTPQYDGLEALYEQYKDKGFSVLAFPCNQFGSQEPGDAGDIAEFCVTKFSIKFPLFEKVDVNGDKALPLYDYLKTEAPGVLGSKGIKWNFTKFLVGKDGKVIKRYAPATSPESIQADIEKALQG